MDWKNKSLWLEFEMPIVELEERIAAFFEARPYFYDLTSSNYKNKFKRKSELQEFAASIGWDGEYHN